MKNRKGFTLVELLVVILILGIITGLSIPLIRNLIQVFNEKKYSTYSETVLNAAKLYNDSYSEDLFGYNENGCACLYYDELVRRNLLKDIQVDGISCASNSTFVRVIKIGDKYSYKAYLGCGEKVGNRVDSITKSFPESNKIYTCDSRSCTGVEENNLFIAASPSVSDKYDKKRKKVKLSITSGTGISDNIDIGIKWSTIENDYSGDFNSIDFKLPNKQKEKLLNGEIISTTSDEIITPKNVTGEYYLIVRVNNLTDLYGTDWKNPSGDNSLFLTFGPYMVDNNPPSAELTVTSTNSNYNVAKVDVNIEASDTEVESDELKYCISTEDNNCTPDINYNSTSKTKRINLGSTDGTKKTIYIAVRDLAGNITRKSVDYQLAISHTLTYDTQGGSVCDPNKKTIVHNKDDGITWGELCTTTKIGNKFRGWYTKKDGKGDLIDKDAEVKENLTVYAYWEKNKAYIYYNVNGGVLTGNQASFITIGPDSLVYKNGELYYTVVEYGETTDSDGVIDYNNHVTPFLDTKREGYVVPKYQEWYNSSGDYYYQSYHYYNDDITSPYYYSDNFCDASLDDCYVELFINWKKEIDVSSYTLTYDSQGGSTCNPKTITKNAGELWVPDGNYCIPTKNNYSFAGWFDQNGKQVYLSTKTASDNITVYAHWKDIYTLSYTNNLPNKNGVKECNEVTKKQVTGLKWYDYQNGENYCKPNTIDKGDSYGKGKCWFYGWFDNNNSQIFFDNATAESDLNVHSKWVTISVLHYLNDNDTYPYRYDNDGTCTYTKVVHEYGDNAVWGNYCVNAETEDEYCKNVTSNKRELCTPVKKGNTFKGWWTGKNATGKNITADTTINEDCKTNINVYAAWEANEYKLTYIDDYGNNCNNKTITKRFGSLWVDSSNGEKVCTPTRTGYTFNGWYTKKTNGEYIDFNKAKVTLDKNINVYAHWTAKKYTLTYNTNGGEGCTTAKTGTYGKAWGTLCTPKKDGHEFLGWYDKDGNEIKSDTIVKGSLTGNARFRKYVVKIYYNVNGGTLTTPRDNKITIGTYNGKSNFVYYEGKIYYTEIEYGTETDYNGLIDYNNWEMPFLNLVNNGYSVPRYKEWYRLENGKKTYYHQAYNYKRKYPNDSTAKTFSTRYTSNDFCVAKTGDCEIVVYVNWIKNN